MSTLVIRLLGLPEIERNGVAVTPLRRRNAWAGLAYEAASERAHETPLQGIDCTTEIFR